jgi:hypothetical protein
MRELIRLPGGRDGAVLGNALGITHHITYGPKEKRKSPVALVPAAERSSTKGCQQFEPPTTLLGANQAMALLVYTYLNNLIGSTRKFDKIV